MSFQYEIRMNNGNVHDVVSEHGIIRSMIMNAANYHIAETQFREFTNLHDEVVWINVDLIGSIKAVVGEGSA